MENFNKIISLIIGLVVVIILIAVFTGKVNFNNKLSFLKPLSPTPTLVPAPTKKNNERVVPTSSYKMNRYQANSANSTGGESGSQTINIIPSTGIPTAMVPLLLTSLLTGFWFKQKK